MTLESILRSIREILSYIPWPHWVAIGVLTLAVALLALRRGTECRSCSSHGRKPQAASPGQHVSEVTPRRTSIYGAVALGIAVFAGLLFIETTVVIRWCGIVTNGWGVHLNLDFKRILFLHSQGYESLFNIVAFVPFGFFLAEYLYVTTHRPKTASIAGDGDDAATGDRPASRPLNCWRRLALTTLATLALSLCIECLQLALHVGFFELTDLMMNTLGGLLGASLSLLLRAVFSPSKK